MLNQHHLLWQRRWYDTGYCRSLRNLPYTKVMLDKKLHKALHEEISGVPIPTGATAKKICYAILNGLIMETIHIDDKPSDRIAFMMDLLSTADKQTYVALKTQYVFLKRRGL